HDRIARGGPGKNKTWIERLAAESVVSRAERAAHDDGEFRNDAVRDCIDELGAGPNNTRLFGLFAHHEAVYVLQKAQRHAALVAVHKETCRFVGAVDVDDAAVLERSRGRAATFALIGNNSNGNSAKSPVSTDHRLAVLGLIFVERLVIENAVQQVADIIF